ncbi:MAG: hypothetical protein GKR99_16970 [Rhodobacteraceae bacterium]|nr:hypothetical protein [Paracoccaceae bacterium]
MPTVHAGAADPCGGAEKIYAPIDQVVARAYVHDGQPTLTLFTVINQSGDTGAHTSLMINGSQRVIWDPAGSFKHTSAPERGDVLFGISPQMLDTYIDYHARKRYRVVEQVLPVSAAVAEQALRIAQSEGPQGNATCSLSTSRLLSGLPGFEGFPVSYFPKKTMIAFAAKGASRRVILDDDDSQDAALMRFPGRHATQP